MMTVTRSYDEAVCLAPYWEGNTVAHESVMFLEDEFRASLLYPAEEIFAVLSADWKTEYRPGVDYALEDGCLVRLPGSAMPFFPLAEYYPASKEGGRPFGCTLPGREYIWFGDSAFLVEKQIDVSYRHSSSWTGKRTLPQPEKFARFTAKAKSGQDSTVLFYGDSITTGCNSSSFNKTPPFVPMWPELVTSALRRRLNAPNIACVNTAIGGKGSGWGLEQVGPRVIDCKPDLLILAFGMNDGGLGGEKYMALTEALVEKVHAALPDCDVCLVATTLPHKRVSGFWGHQSEYEPLLENFAAPLPWAGTVPMSSIHAHMLARKQFYHMTGNNVNHPNDFLARAYAMAILEALAV